MFPIYMWIDRYKGLENFKIIFDNNYKIEFNKDESTLSIIKKDITDNNIKNFYSIDKTKGNIDSVNLLIGKNGSGKTSVLEVLGFGDSKLGILEGDDLDEEDLLPCRNSTNSMILYKFTNDKNFILETREKNGFRKLIFIKVGKDKKITIENKTEHYYDNIKKIGMIKFSLKKKIMNTDLRRLNFINEYRREDSIHKLNMGFGNGSKKKIYNYLTNINQKNNDNFENVYLVLLIPNLYEKYKEYLENIEYSDIDLNIIDDTFKLYNIDKSNSKDIIVNNYLNFLYLAKILRDFDKKSKKLLKKEKKEILRLLKNKSPFEKIKTLLEKIEKEEHDWIDYDEKKYKIIEEIANLVKDIPKKEIHMKYEDDTKIIKKFRINFNKNKKIIELLEKYDTFHTPNIEEAYHSDYSSFREMEFIKIEEEGLSDGEKIKLQYFSTLHGVLNGEFKDREYITLLFDEVETYLHPEWSRRFLYELIEELGRYEDKKFKLIFATHSPFLIADVLAKDCIYLSKNKKGKIKAEIKEDVKTFGANIIDLFKDTMFLESTFGKFATEKIKGVVDKIEKAEKYSDIKHEVDFIIDEIGEKLISNKLKSMIESKFENKDEEYYRKKIKEYRKKLRKLKKEG